MNTATARKPIAWAKDALRALQGLRGNAFGCPAVAEAHDVKFTSIEERRTETGHVLHLEGLVFHSALAVEEVSVRSDGDALVVEVRLTPATAGRSGSFAADVPLSESTGRILFGTNRSPIWRKGT